MKTNEQQLAKHFSLILKGRASSKDTREMLPVLQRYLSRKELIEVIKKAHNGTVPAELNVAELENEELVSFIGDEMYILAYMTEKWCREVQAKPAADPKQDNTNAEVKKVATAENKPNKK